MNPITTRENTFHKKSKNIIENRDNQEFVRIIFWGVAIYSKLSIYRNKFWWGKNIYLIENFWEKVLNNRKLPTTELVNIQKKNRKKNIELYAFLPDSDDDNDMM